MACFPRLFVHTFMSAKPFVILFLASRGALYAAVIKELFNIVMMLQFAASGSTASVLFDLMWVCSSVNLLYHLFPVVEAVVDRFELVLVQAFLDACYGALQVTLVHVP